MNNAPAQMCLVFSWSGVQVGRSCSPYARQHCRCAWSNVSRSWRTSQWPGL